MKKEIQWEKWVDPYARNLEDFEDVGYEFSEDESDAMDLIEQGFLPKIPTKGVVLTPMGAIPINEYTNPSKIFNFWTGHTSFVITEEIATLIESSEGVETFNVFTPYRFRIAIAKMFKDSDVMNQIIKNVNCS